MLERLNPVFRLATLALAGLVIYQVSQLAFKRDVLARGSFSTTAIKSASEKKDTNAPPKATATSTNAPTNAAPLEASQPPPEMTLPPGMVLPPGVTLPPGMSMPPGLAMRVGPGARPGRGAPSNLPPEVAAMVEKIKTSQILGPDIKPPPMALLGIAGKDVFLRSPTGQTGIIREGEELGGVKLLKVGTNRVLVEFEKETKELTIFSGFGSETLLPSKEGKK